MMIKLKRWINTPKYKVPIAEFYVLGKFGNVSILNEIHLDKLKALQPEPITKNTMLRELGKCPEARKDIYSYLKKMLHEDAVKFAPLKTGIGIINDEMIYRAKQVPITELLGTMKNKIECLWHVDTQPSLSYHQKGNFVKCFACDAYADSIGVYQKINNCDFKTSVIEMQ